MGAPGGRRILGIDEAGRGSFLGPLVVGGFLVEEDRLAELRPAGARDSKLLSATARERTLETLRSIGEARTIRVSAAEVDRHVHRGKLNDLEAEAFGSLVRDLEPDVVYVDACDPNARRFGREVRRRSRTNARIVARHKADRDLPVVGAASIVAKVERDRAVAELAASLGAVVGSGYPSDRVTIEFVRATLATGAPPPAWLRASWSTMQRIIPARPARSLEEFSDDRRGGPRLRRGPV